MAGTVASLEVVAVLVLNRWGWKVNNYFIVPFDLKFSNSGYCLIVE